MHVSKISQALKSFTLVASCSLLETAHEGDPGTGIRAITGARLLRATRPSGGLSTATRACATASRRPTRHARRVRALGAALGGPLAQQDAVAALDGDRNALPKLANKRCPEAVVVQQPLLAIGCGEGPDVSQISQAQIFYVYPSPTLPHAAR